MKLFIYIFIVLFVLFSFVFSNATVFNTVRNTVQETVLNTINPLEDSIVTYHNIVNTAAADVKNSTGGQVYAVD